MRFFEGDADRVATILPGASYAPDRSLLHFTCKALVDDGWTVRQVWWHSGGATTPNEAFEQAREAIAEAGRARHQVVVGMGLGTYAWPEAIARSLPAVWLAPRFGDEAIVRSAAATVEPTLVIGGTGDPLWNEAAARAGRAQVHEIADADHSLEIPGSMRESVKRQETALARIWDFMAGLLR